MALLRSMNSRKKLDHRADAEIADGRHLIVVVRKTTWLLGFAAPNLPWFHAALESYHSALNPWLTRTDDPDAYIDRAFEIAVMIDAMREREAALECSQRRSPSGPRARALSPRPKSVF